jgi:hypothetical protein
VALRCGRTPTEGEGNDPRRVYAVLPGGVDPGSVKAELKVSMLGSAVRDGIAKRRDFTPVSSEETGENGGHERAITREERARFLGLASENRNTSGIAKS